MNPAASLLVAQWPSFLGADVLSDDFGLVRRDEAITVALLPEGVTSHVKSKFGEPLINQPSRCSLEVMHRSGEVLPRRQRYEQMHVILDRQHFEDIDSGAVGNFLKRGLDRIANYIN